MDRLNCSTYFEAVTNRPTDFQDTAFSETGTSCQAFSRDVIEVANILCAMGKNKTTKNFLQQPEVPIAINSHPLNCELLQRNASPAGNKLDVKSSASGTGESLTISHAKAYARSGKRKAFRKAYQMAYAQSEKGKACKNSYEQSEKGKAARKAYNQSERRKSSRKAYEQSEKRKAVRKAYRESEKGKAYMRAYRKAYNEVIKSTGDKEQAKVAARQATAFIKESNKAKK